MARYIPTRVNYYSIAISKCYLSFLKSTYLKQAVFHPFGLGEWRKSDPKPLHIDSRPS